MNKIFRGEAMTDMYASTAAMRGFAAALTETADGVHAAVAPAPVSGLGAVFGVFGADFLGAWAAAHDAHTATTVALAELLGAAGRTVAATADAYEVVDIAGTARMAVGGPL